MSTKIMLSSINDVKVFVNTANTFDCDIDLISGRYIIDAKSIMGIFSLDISKPIEVKVSDDEKATEFFKKISQFVVQ